MGKKLKLKKKKQKEIIAFMQNRLIEYQLLRNEFDDAISEEIDIANDVDKNMKPYDETTQKGKQWWEESRTVPYTYTIIQTMVARLIQSFFGKQNYLKIYVETPYYKKWEKELTSWVQYELDKIKLKSRARDFMEESLIERTTWLRLRPVMNGSGKMTRVDFDIFPWFDVWFDTSAKEVEQSDWFLKDVIPLYKIRMNEKKYMNVKDIYNTFPPDMSSEEREKFEAKNDKDGNITYYSTELNSTSEKVEIMEYNGWYDLSDDVNNPDYQPVIFTMANREVLISAEKIDLDTKKKFLIFPIRPIRQANSLIGKSVGQIVGDMQYLLNDIFSYVIHNFKLLVKMMFKYDKNADIDLDDLFAGAGNAIGYDGDPNSIQVFEVKNNVSVGLMVASWVIQFMQQATGAVDYLMGTSAARGSTETASGIKTITEQAMFKFAMMAENINGDMQELINFMIILWSKYNPDEVIRKFPGLEEFFNQSDEDLEDSQVIDIGLNDLTLRRDVERTAFINGINVIAGLLERVGGNVPALLKEVMEKLEVENIESIMSGAIAPNKAQEMITAAMASAGGGKPNDQTRGGSTKANPQADNAATPEEEANNTTPKKPTGGS